jgi:hypothetical protein
MIFITGDIHGNPVRFSTDNFYEQKEFSGNKDDNFVIICGDFGLVWNCTEENKTEKYWLDWLESKPFTTCFVDGNHENFDRLDAYPVEEWNGGKVHKIRPHVIHLMRGQVFEIEDKKFFTFGGASSHDISDGILDPFEDRELIKEWRNDWSKMFRVNHVSWWERELPSEEEMQEGIENLNKYNNKVDYIISHSPSASVIALLGKGLYEQDKLTKYLEEIRCNTEYKRMYSGHMHVDRAVNDKDILLYEQIIRIV